MNGEWRATVTTGAWRVRRVATAGLVLCLAAGSAAAEVTGDTEFDCVITPKVVVDVSSAEPGLLEDVSADRAQPVRAGEPLARLESGVEAANVDYADARASIESDVALEKVRLEFDARTRERVDTLYQQSATSLQTRDEAELSASMAELRVKHAREERRLRDLELRRAQAALERRTVRSPVDGVVLQRFKHPGEYVENEPILRVAALDPLRVEAIVPMPLFGKIQAGMQAEIVDELGAGARRLAQVDVVDPIADPASGTFGVRLELANPEHRIAAGQKCRVRFLADAALRPEPAPAASAVAAPVAAARLEAAEPPAVVERASEGSHATPVAATGRTPRKAPTGTHPMAPPAAPVPAAFDAFGHEPTGAAPTEERDLAANGRP